MEEWRRARKGCLTAVGACHRIHVTDRTLKTPSNRRPYYRLARLDSRPLGLAGEVRTIRYPGIEVDDALEISEQTEA